MRVVGGTYGQWCPSQAFLPLCRRSGYAPRIVAQGDGFSVTQGYVSVGLGVALAPVLALGAIRRHVVVRKLSKAPPASLHLAGDPPGPRRADRPSGVVGSVA